MLEAREQQRTDFGEAAQHSEGKVARRIEEQTARLPSDTFLWTAVAAMGASLFLQMTDRKHESLFVGTRGKVPCPAPGTQWASVVEAPVGDHSAKPDVFRVMLEEYFPSLPKLELFGRGEAPEGWDVFGNEAGAPAL